jgi:hypothetical protein
MKKQARDPHGPAHTGPASRRRRHGGGRPPAGFRAGEKVRDYPQLSVRVPQTIKLTLRAISVLQSKPQWRVVIESIDCFVRSLSVSDQRKLKTLIDSGLRYVQNSTG